MTTFFEPTSRMPTINVKFGARTLTAASGTAAAVKTALTEPTGLSVLDMRLVSRGKVLSDAAQVASGAKVMLLRCSAAKKHHLTIRDIISGRDAKVDVAVNCSHDDLTEIALTALGLPPEAEVGTCLRLYLPHVTSLMRIDLTLADYAGATVVYLVPCAPGLRLDSAASAEAVAEATRAEMAAAAAARAQIEATVETELLRYASASFAEEADSDEQAPSSSSPSSAALVPARIRTGLMPSMDDIQVVPVPLQALIELDAFEAYDAEMRELSALPAETARELMVAAEEARLEERCAMLVSTLEPAAEGGTERSAARPGTPVHCKPHLGLQTHPGLQSFDDLSEVCMSCVEGMDSAVSLPASIKPTSARKLRCKSCACRLPLTAATTAGCACGDVFCASHMHAHECPFDFRSREQDKLAKANEKVESSKLERM